eukprot:Platyproteum_vivax@DN2976_c0_g1_i1.p1
MISNSTNQPRRYPSDSRVSYRKITYKLPQYYTSSQYHQLQMAKAGSVCGERMEGGVKYQVVELPEKHPENNWSMAHNLSNSCSNLTHSTSTSFGRGGILPYRTPFNTPCSGVRPPLHYPCLVMSQQTIPTDNLTDRFPQRVYEVRSEVSVEGLVSAASTEPADIPNKYEIHEEDCDMEVHGGYVVQEVDDLEVMQLEHTVDEDLVKALVENIVNDVVAKMVVVGV